MKFCQTKPLKYEDYNHNYNTSSVGIHIKFVLIKEK